MSRIPYQKLDFAKSLRKELTEAEKKLWRLLRSRQLENFKFRRQRVIGPYVADFCCLNPKLIVELDGAQHQDHKVYDSERTRYLASEGYRVIRFWNNEILRHPAEATHRIFLALTRPLPPSAGEE